MPYGHVKIKCHSSYEATYINVHNAILVTSENATRMIEWTNDKQIEIALAKIHRSRGDLARVKTVNVVKNRWLPSLRSAAIKSCCYPRLPLIPHQIFSLIVWNVLIYYYKTFMLQKSWRYTRISLLWPIWTLFLDLLFLVGGRHTIITCEKWQLPIWK
jgi:hypothetical protein